MYGEKTVLPNTHESIVHKYSSGIWDANSILMVIRYSQKYVFIFMYESIFTMICGSWIKD